jgi:hypothetical protein
VTRAADSALGRAIHRKDWDTVALLLALGVARAAAKLPEADIEDVIHVLLRADSRKAIRERGRRGRA